MSMTMTMRQNSFEDENRVFFPRQPARILLVDFMPPFNSEMCGNLCQAIHDVFTIACNISGPSRIPLFGIFALGNFPEALFPLQSVKGSFPHLTNALTDLANYHEERLGTKPSTCCITQGLQDAYMQYKRQTQGLLQTAGYWCQLEVTIVTSHGDTTVTKQVEKVINEIDADSLKKVQILCINIPDHMDTTDMTSQISNKSETSTDSAGLDGMVEAIIVECGLPSLQNYFKGWLTDNGTDKEHMHLILPKSTKENVMIKCDVHEGMINPTQLPFSSSFHLQPDFTNSRPSIQVNPKPQGLTVPVHKIVAVNLMPGDSLCESVIYGMPCVLKPTTCWKIDWDDLESNQQQFHALCHTLQQKNMVLLAKLENQEVQTSNLQPKPCGHFVILPSPANALLLKPIAVSELMLPTCELIPLGEQLPQENIESMELALDQLEVLPQYNPLMIQSGLYSSLSSMLTFSSSRLHNKRKYPHHTNSNNTPSSSMTSATNKSLGRVQPMKRQEPVRKFCAPARTQVR